MRKHVSRVLLGLTASLLLGGAFFIQFTDAGATPLGIKYDAVFVGSLAVFAFTALVTLWSLDHTNDKVLGGVAHVNEMMLLSSHAPIRRMTFEASFDYLAHRLQSSRDVVLVQNTIIGPAVARQILNYDRYLAAKRGVITKGAKWQDLMTPGVPARGYYAVALGRECEADYYVALLRGEEESRANYLNFTTLRGTDSLGAEYSEVVMGWESTPARPDQADEVISIVDQVIYARFRRHFSNLWDESADIVWNGKAGLSGGTNGGFERLLESYRDRALSTSVQRCRKCADGRVWVYAGFGGQLRVCSNYPGTCDYFKTVA